jgi:lipid II:glycine glycyltransferase (peptidoglycan interpeptide bridge formation enzyme)
MLKVACGMVSHGIAIGAAKSTILRSAASQMLEDQFMGVYEVDPLQDQRWNALVQGHAHGSVFHSPGWLEALRTTYGYDPVVISTCAPNETLTNGLVFCRVRSWLTGHRMVSVPFSDHCEPLVNNADELHCLLSTLKHRVDDGEWKYIEIRPVTLRPSSRSGLTQSLTYEFHRLDLRKSKQVLFRGFHKDCVQRKIRRAEREKLQYEEGTSEDLLQKFYRLLVMTRRRQYLPPQPLSWFRGLIAAFGTDLKIRVASKDGVAVASILTLSHKKTMVYKYGCSNLAFNNLGGTALLFWNAIQEATDNGLEELEMGRSDVDNFGLIAFKEHWGASGTRISYWTYPHSGTGLPSVWKKKLARYLVPAVPDLALRTVGRLLYKHIG